MLGRAARAEGRALRRLALTAEDQAADALALQFLLRHDRPEAGLGVEIAISVGEPQAALLDFADAPPAPRHDTKHLAHDLLSRLIAAAADGARILVLDLRPPGLE